MITTTPLHSFNEQVIDHSELLILERQLQEVQEFRGRAKGKGREGKSSEDDISVNILQDELHSRITTLRDHILCQSMMRAVCTDHRIIFQQHQEEEAAHRDRELAVSLSDGRADATRTTEATNDTGDKASDERIDTELMAKWAMLYINDDTAMSILGSDDDSEQAESSTAAACRAAREEKLTRTCVACTNKFKLSDIGRTPCGHEYCGECLAEVFPAAMTNEAYFPPRCCRATIPLDSVRFFLPYDLVKEFRAKLLELETKDRTYCHVPTCSAFISPNSFVNDVGTCRTCGSLTCSMCKSEGHGGDCPADADGQIVLRVARESNWQRCFQCRQIVELDTGCNHITCRCGAHFCYVCGAVWKTCQCPQWHEENLLARANQVFDRGNRDARHENADPIAVAGVAQARNHAVRRLAEQLRVNHDCEHENWRYIRGEHNCEECRHTLPQYIFQCRGCRMHACWRCRRHRL
ncbi:hypothetical protein KVT40_002266 [Elsinoe batatas]|uniref:RBR-type E3 ubiquitin transferase n=1 Tax=Elsinoe batatas TaxID=2601811 RepID=A0A8K0PJL2_9PEZI|nr:hypothetical protein KVT40_002266 [Elsinoe batatas]